MKVISYAMSYSDVSYYNEKHTSKIQTNVMKQSKRKYTLDELIAQCDLNAPLENDKDWLEMQPVGNEII